MRHILRPLILLTLLLAACTPGGSPPDPAPVSTSVITHAAPTESVPTAPAAIPVRSVSTAAPAAARNAVLTSLINQVLARPAQDADFSPAQEGQSIPENGQAKTEQDSRASLVLHPEGTAIRIGPNTLFTVQALSSPDESPSSRIRLFFGEIWIALSGGEMQVETPSGVASVRGSYLNVRFSPSTGELLINCLEGKCLLANKEGLVQLTGGQSSRIPGRGKAPERPCGMMEQEFMEWVIVSEDDPSWEMPAMEEIPWLEKSEWFNEGWTMPEDTTWLDETEWYTGPEVWEQPELTDWPEGLDWFDDPALDLGDWQEDGSLIEPLGDNGEIVETPEDGILDLPGDGDGILDPPDEGDGGFNPPGGDGGGFDPPGGGILNP